MTLHHTCTLKLTLVFTTKSHHFLKAVVYLGNCLMCDAWRHKSRNLSCDYMPACQYWPLYNNVLPYLSTSTISTAYQHAVLTRTSRKSDLNDMELCLPD